MAKTKWKLVFYALDWQETSFLTSFSLSASTFKMNVLDNLSDKWRWHWPFSAVPLNLSNFGPRNAVYMHSFSHTCQWRSYFDHTCQGRSYFSHTCQWRSYFDHTCQWRSYFNHTCQWRSYFQYWLVTTDSHSGEMNWWYWNTTRTGWGGASLGGTAPPVAAVRRHSGSPVASRLASLCVWSSLCSSYLHVLEQWVETPWGGYRRFGRTYRPHLHHNSTDLDMKEIISLYFFI
jgi:hypothetical protein